MTQDKKKASLKRLTDEEIVALSSEDFRDYVRSLPDWFEKEHARRVRELDRRRKWREEHLEAERQRSLNWYHRTRSKAVREQKLREREEGRG